MKTGDRRADTTTRIGGTVLVALVLLALAGCGGSTPQDPPVSGGTPPPSSDPPPSDASFEFAACPFQIPSGQVEGSTMRCGFLTVPEDRSDLASRTIRLAIALFANPNRTSSDAIVYLAGGPGSSALEFLHVGFDANFAPLFATGRDLVIFDQRGVGVSQPALDCPPDASTVSELLACASSLRSRADLSDYHTAANAADVEDMRRLLEYDQINLWGISYGTRLALDVMRDYPGGLRSVVLDSVFPPDVDLLLETPQNADRAMRHLFGECAADPACNSRYPDLDGTLVAAATRLDASPATVTLFDPYSRTTFDVQLDGGDFVGILFQFLYVADLLPELPRMIHDAAVGRFDVVERYLGAFIGQAVVTKSTGMRYSVLCHDEVAFSTKSQYEAVAATYPLIQPALRDSGLGTLAYDVCAGWGAGSAGPIENTAVSSSVPTLLLAGEYDPITPPAWVQRAANTLPSGRAFFLPAVGHGATLSPCGRRMMIDFVRNPQAAPDSSCIGALRVDWSLFASAGETAVDPDVLTSRLATLHVPDLD